MEGGYTAIGMDHFALKEDTLTKSYLQKTLTRNFQGYSVGLAEDMIGFGLSSIGYIEGAYFQNHKDLQEYQKAIDGAHLATSRGLILNEDDLKRKKIIEMLMCHFEVEKGDFDIDWSDLISDGLITVDASHIRATPLGRIFIRLIAAKFDAYIDQGQYSKSI